MHIPENSAKME